MSMLRNFQSEFAGYLLSPRLAAMPAREAAAMNVYRNTVMKGLIDVLAANYPTVLKLVGGEWFNGAATEYARSVPPGSPVLAAYGKDFWHFLESFPPAFDLPYLSEVARTDWLWIESYFAPDATALSASMLQTLSGEQLMLTPLALHAATRVIACNYSAVSIWQHNRSDNPDIELQVSDRDEFALITRISNVVQLQRLDAQEYAFVNSIGKATLGETAIMLLEQDPQFPVANTLAKLVNSGCFASLSS